jgi:hypothetical protein
MRINIPGLPHCRHTDDLTIRDYFSFFNMAPKLPRYLRHLADRHGVPYAVPGGADGDDAALSSGTEAVSDDDGDNARQRNDSASNVRAVWRDSAEFPRDPYYVWRRSRRCVARLPAFSPNVGELYYLRVLLLRVPARSFEELRTFNGEVLPTYRAAAEARNLIPRGDEARIAMTEIAAEINADPATATPSQLRHLFCIYCIHHLDAADPPALFNEFWGAMSRDITRPGFRPGVDADAAGRMSDNMLKALLVRRLNRTLTDWGRALDKFIPDCNRYEEALSPEERALLAPLDDLVAEHRNAQTVAAARLEFQRKYAVLTAEQRVIVDYWMQERSAGRRPMIFIDALAGRGKTFVMSAYLFVVIGTYLHNGLPQPFSSRADTIGAWERSMGHLPVFAAYTGIVSLLHLLGMTCHRLFGLPISNDETPGVRPVSTLQFGSEIAKLLRAATMIGIDEVLMHKCVNHLHNLMRSRLQSLHLHSLQAC